jgi:hypothetical protein
MKNFNDLAAAGLEPGSIYTHDTHAEKVLIKLAEDVGSIAAQTAEDIDAAVQRRLSAEKITGANGLVANANASLDTIAENSRTALDLQKQEIEVLKSMLAALTTGVQPSGETRSQIIPQSPPNFYQWAVRHINSPNFGGVDNYVRG